MIEYWFSMYVYNSSSREGTESMYALLTRGLFRPHPFSSCLLLLKSVLSVIDCLTRARSHSGHAEEAQLPYFDLIPSDPSLEEVQKMVCVERRRPSFPNPWNQHEVTHTNSAPSHSLCYMLYVQHNLKCMWHNVCYFPLNAYYTLLHSLTMMHNY